MPVKRNDHFLLISSIVAFLLVTYFGLHIARAGFDFPHGNLFEVMSIGFENALNKPFNIIYLNRVNWLYFGSCMLFTLFIEIWLFSLEEQYKYRYPNKEKGQSKWNDFHQYNKKFAYICGKKGFTEPDIYSEEKGNMIFSQNVRLCMDIRKTLLNNNVLIDGSTGAGKTRFLVKPNILQQNCSYVITDPSGELLADCGTSLMEAGYELKVFNLAEMDYSCGYNPFHYIRSDENVLDIVKCMMKNTDDSKASKGDDFFMKAETAFFQACFYHIYYFEKPENKNIGFILKMLSMAKVDEKNPEKLSELDKLFERDKRKDENSPAVLNYDIFRTGTGKTLKSILISAGVRLAPFTTPKLTALMARDTLDLEKLGDSKHALFIITPAETKTYNFVAAMMYTQLFNTLYHHAGVECTNRYQIKKGSCISISSPMFRTSKQKKDMKKELEDKWEIYKNGAIEKEDDSADDFYDEDENGAVKTPRYFLKAKNGTILETFQNEAQANIFFDCIQNGKLKRGTKQLASNVRCILDEFANIGEIPEFIGILSTMRKYGISCDIILQSIQQIKEMYHDNYGTLINNCNTQIFLGGTFADDIEYFSKALGDTTIETVNSSISRGKNTSSSQSRNKDTRPLMKPEEIGKLPLSECLVLIAGQHPFRDKKYHLENHPRYKTLADDNPEKIFDYHGLFHIVPTEKKESLQSLVEKGDMSKGEYQKKVAESKKKAGHPRNKRGSTVVDATVAYGEDRKDPNLVDEAYTNCMNLKHLTKYINDPDVKDYVLADATNKGDSNGMISNKQKITKDSKETENTQSGEILDVDDDGFFF